MSTSHMSRNSRIIGEEERVLLRACVMRAQQGMWRKMLFSLPCSHCGFATSCTDTVVCQKSQRTGCVIPRCKLQRGITQPILFDISLQNRVSTAHLPDKDDCSEEGPLSSEASMPLGRTLILLRANWQSSSDELRSSPWIIWENEKNGPFHKLKWQNNRI